MDFPKSGPLRWPMLKRKFLIPNVQYDIIGCTKHLWYCQLTSFLSAPHENQGKYDEFPRHGFYHGLSSLEEKGKNIEYNEFLLEFILIRQDIGERYVQKSTKTKYATCIKKIFHSKKFLGIWTSDAGLIFWVKKK